MPAQTLKNVDTATVYVLYVLNSNTTVSCSDYTFSDHTGCKKHKHRDIMGSFTLTSGQSQTVPAPQSTNATVGIYIWNGTSTPAEGAMADAYIRIPPTGTPVYGSNPNSVPQVLVTHTDPNNWAVAVQNGHHGHHEHKRGCHNKNTTTTDNSWWGIVVVVIIIIIILLLLWAFRGSSSSY